MTARTQVVIYCDGPECTELHGPHPGADPKHPRDLAWRDGWTREDASTPGGSDGRDLCPFCQTNTTRPDRAKV